MDFDWLSEHNPLINWWIEVESGIEWVYVQQLVKIHRLTDLYHVPQGLYNLNHLIVVQAVINLTVCKYNMEIKLLR